jgi:L-fuculose-phosphate aldolase
MKNQKKQIIEICRLLARKGYVAATDGNVSLRAGDNRVLITPSGINKEFLKKKDLVLTDLEGNKIKGKHKPSSEIKMHLKIYKERSDINAVVHAHPPLSLAFSYSGESLDVPVLPEVVLTLGKIPEAEYATPTTDEVVKNLEPHIKDNNAILMSRHGSVTMGKDIYSAYNNLEKLEHTAKIIFYSKQLGKVITLTDEEIEKLKNINHS